jgi:hypothetical protein
MNTVQFSLLFAALAIMGPLLSSANRAQASIIYDNQAAPTNAASTSDAAGLIRADDFILQLGMSTVTGVQWTGQYGGSTDISLFVDNFTIQFFNSEPADDPTPLPPFQSIEEPQDANLAIATITVTNPNRTQPDPNFLLFQYSASFAPLVLVPNTRYWVSIFNDVPGATPTWLWRSQLTGLQGSASDVAAVRNQVNEWGNEIGNRYDFQLLGPDPGPGGAIPEAASLIVWSLLAVFGSAICSRTCRSQASTSHA